MNEKAANSNLWSAGRVLPRLMFCCFLLDLVLRLVPLDPLTFRAWEAMLRRLPNAVGPFIPDKHYHREDSYGGVAAMGNLPWLRHAHAVDFTTDGYGFHNSPAPAEANPGGMVIGDSFAVGSELAENETLSAQLSKQSGRYFYNAGAPQPLRLASVEALAHRLGLRSGVVCFEFLEARALESPPSATPDGAHGRLQGRVLRTLGTNWTDRMATPLNEWHASPLEALSVKVEKKIQNGWFLPNSFARLVIQDTLRNGQRVVFLPAEFRSPTDPRGAAAAWAGYFAWYASELSKAGLELTVLLVPNRTTIYAPLLQHPQDVSAAQETLSDLAIAIHGAGVPAISLEARFAEEAARRMGQNEYLYFLDDTHWNGNGTAIAADELLRNSATGCNGGRPRCQMAAPQTVP